jgi:hypothetical protein
VATTKTEEQATNQDGDAGGPEQEQQPTGDSGARKALKVGALAAAAGTAAYAASKAVSSRGDDGQRSENGSARGGRVSVEQLVSAIGTARWDVLRDIVVPFAESGASSAGAYIAKDAPDFLAETLVPKFIEGFNEARGQRSESTSS